MNPFIFSNRLIYILKEFRVFFVASTFLDLHEFYFALLGTETKSAVFKYNWLVFVASVHKTFSLPIKFLMLSKIKFHIAIYKNSNQKGCGMLFLDVFFVAFCYECQQRYMFKLHFSKNFLWLAVILYTFDFNLFFFTSFQKMFLQKSVLKIWSKLTGEQPYQSVISIKLLCKFIEIKLWHGCSVVNLLDLLRTPFYKNT